MTGFLLLGSKISVDGDWSHEIREGLFSRKPMKNLVSVSKSRKDLKRLLMRVEEESERASLRLNIKKLRSWHPAPLLHGK